MLGLLQENGPFLWQPGTYRPYANPYSWVNLTNMVRSHCCDLEKLYPSGKLTKVFCRFGLINLLEQASVLQLREQQGN